MSGAGIDSRYYKLMLDMLNTVYLEQELEPQITRALGTIGAFFKVSRVYVFEDDLENGISRNTYEWCADGIEPQIAELQEVPLRELGPWHTMLREFGMVLASDIQTLPEEICEILAPQEICAIVVLPLYLDNVMFGYIGFDECRAPRTWSSEEVEALHALSNLVVNLIARHRAEQKAAVSQRMLRTVLDNIDTPVYATDPKTSRILFANRKFGEELGCAEPEGKICWEVVRVGEQGECELCPRRKLLGMAPGTTLNWEVYNDRIDKWYYCTDRFIEWIDGGTAHLQAALNITARKEYEAQLEFSASFDTMTGIYNRASGLKLLKDMVTAGRQEGLPLTVCFLDVDGLKCVNDTFGHAEGDRLIKAVVDTIRSVIRTTDVFARLGGDEFMLALRACPQESAGIVIDKINNQFGKLNRVGAYPFTVSISVGLVEVTPEMDCGLDTILLTADERMYADKQTKKERREA